MNKSRLPQPRGGNERKNKKKKRVKKMNCATDGVGAAAVVAAGIDGYWHQWLVQFVRPTHFINANATKKERNQGIIQMKKIQREKKNGEK